MGGVYVSGQIVDAQTHKGIPSASVEVVDFPTGKKYGKGAVADSNGMFMLDADEIANDNAAILFTSVGYADQTLFPKYARGLVEMNQDPTALAEVTVVAKIKKKVQQHVQQAGPGKWVAIGLGATILFFVIRKLVKHKP